MKKIVSIILVLVVILSGCIRIPEVEPDEETENSDETIYDKRANEEAVKYHENFIEEYYYFNLDDFSFEGSHNSKNNTTLTTVTYNPIEEADRIKYNDGGGFGYNQVTLTNLYYTSYIFDDFIFDTSKGNDLESMFKELDKQGIEYHIQNPAVGTVSGGWEKYYRNTYATLSHPLMLKPDENSPLRLPNQIDNFLKTEIVDAYDNESMDKYREYVGYYPVIVIDLVFDEESTEAREYYDEWAKQYYNSEVMEVRFGELYKKYELDGESGVMLTDPIDDESERDTYMYFDTSLPGYDRKGMYIHGYSLDRYVRRRIENQDEDKEGDEYNYIDDRGVTYPWREE